MSVISLATIAATMVLARIAASFLGRVLANGSTYQIRQGNAVIAAVTAKPGDAELSHKLMSAWTASARAGSSGAVPERATQFRSP